MTGRRVCSRLLMLLVCLWAGVAHAQLVTIESPAQGMISHRDRLSVIARGYPGHLMTLFLNGEQVNALSVRPDMYADFLNVSAPQGPVLLQVRQTQPNGQTLSDSVRIHVVGRVARVQVEVQPETLPADTLSRATVDVRVVDAWGVSLIDGQTVTLHLSRGKILTEDLYPEQPGVQICVREGHASAVLQPPPEIGEGVLRVTANDVTTENRINYTVPLAQWTLVGTASGQFGWQQAEPPGAGTVPGGVFERGSYADGKVAFFTQGSFGDGYRLKASFDSDRKYDDRLFRYLTPEQVYPIYGDASSIFYEAPSASRLFVNVAGGRSHLQYGDFATRLSQTELSAYTRSFTGVSSVIKQDWATLRLFGASTEQAIQVDEIPGEGVSGHYYLSASRRGISIVEGSERIVIQTRDRLHPEQVLKEEYQYRFTDYDINYEAGTLLFKRPVPNRSADENLIVILATYETVQSLDKHWVGGGRVAIRPGAGFSLGSTLVGEERQGQNYWLTALDGRWRPTDRFTLSSEVARTDARQEGWAWKVEAQGQLRSDLSYDLYYRDSDAAFDNPSSATARPGVMKMRGRTTWRPSAVAGMSSEVFYTEDDINRESRRSWMLNGTYDWGVWAPKGAIDVSALDRGGNRTQSTTLNVGLDWSVSSRLEVGVERDQSFGDEDLNYRPTLTRLHSRWRLSSRMDLVGEHAFRDGGFVDSSYTLVGLQSRLSDDLTAYAKYELDGGIQGQRNQAIVGLRHIYRVRPDVTLHTTFERIHTLRGDRQSDFFAYSLAAEYLPMMPVKASARFEKRDGQTLDKTVLSYAADWSVYNGLSILLKHTFLDETRGGVNASSRVKTHHLLSGLAYRPRTHDRMNTLCKFELKYESNSLLDPQITLLKQIGSFETILEPRSQFEWFVRYAFKIARLSSEGLATRSLTDLWMTNLRYEWHTRWDTQLEYRVLVQHSANTYRHGFAGEIGHVLAKDTRFAVGYNFAGFQDRDFSGQAYWGRGPYVKIQMKFMESDVAGWLRGLR
jgi:hypothetical protein